MTDVDVLVVGGGETGLEVAEAAEEAGAHVVVYEKSRETQRATDVRVVGGTMVLDVILSDAGEVAGALVVDEAANEVRPVRAGSVVLACGGIGALYSEGLWPHETGDGYVIAHRAGAELVDFRVAFAPEAYVEGGVAANPDGATRVPGLFVSGVVAVSRAVGAAAGRRAAHDAPDEPRPFGDYSVMPNIDSPLPKGFVGAKFDRLRGIMVRHLGPEGPRDVERALIELHKLKGEADDFARARVDSELLSFRNACEAAVLVARRVSEG